MSQEQWTAVDNYISQHLVGPDPALDAALAASDDAGLPQISVAPNQGKLLQILAQMQGARTILEVGTLGGYSTIWLARALPPDGRLVTLEFDPKHAEVARRNIAHAGLAEKVEIRVGAALDTLPKLADEGYGPFDFVFIDADKRNNPAYFSWALKHSRSGSVIIVDNTVREGRILDAESDDAHTLGVRHLYEMLASEPRVTATALQTVGGKGWDGFVIARVK